MCSLLSSKSRTCNVLHIAAFRLSSCSLIREITVSRWSLSRTQFSRYTIDTHTRASRCHVTPSSRSYKTLCPEEELDCAPSKRKTLNWTPFAWLNSSGHRTGFSTTEDFNKPRRKCFRTGHPSTDNNWDCPSLGAFQHHECTSKRFAIDVFGDHLMMMSFICSCRNNK